LFPGHVGTIYQATNALYAGGSSQRLLTLLPTGEVLNERATSKVRKRERGHEAVEGRLCALGASASRAGQQGAAWLTAALEQIGAVALRHRGQLPLHLGDRRPGPAGQRTAVVVTTAPYPKGLDS
jgi:hypothetical protein